MTPQQLLAIYQRDRACWFPEYDTTWQDRRLLLTYVHRLHKELKLCVTYLDEADELTKRLNTYHSDFHKAALDARLLLTIGET